MVVAPPSVAQAPLQHLGLRLHLLATAGLCGDRKPAGIWPHLSGQVATFFLRRVCKLGVVLKVKRQFVRGLFPMRALFGGSNAGVGEIAIQWQLIRGLTAAGVHRWPTAGRSQIRSAHHAASLGHTQVTLAKTAATSDTIQDALCLRARCERCRMPR